MITKAFIQESGNGRHEVEMQQVYEELRQRRVPVELFVAKRLRRRQLPLASDTLVVGYVDTVLAAFQVLGVEPPPTNDYPEVLQPLLHRRIWESTVKQLIERVHEGTGAIFAKPKGRRKRFTGHVFTQPDDLHYIEGTSGTTPIYCSEIVEWLSEYRVFVMQGSIVGIKHYTGDPTIKIDQQIAAEAIRLLAQKSETPSTYAIDLGVIHGGQTALVEWNDAFSLGSYGLDNPIYTDLLITRWCEITACQTSHQ